MLELKRGGRTLNQTEIVEVLTPCRSRPQKTLIFWSFHVVVAHGRQRDVQKNRDARAEMLFC